VKNDYGTKKEARALNGLEKPLKKYSCYFSSVYVKLIKAGDPAAAATMSANAKTTGTNMAHSANDLNSEFFMPGNKCVAN
jgi:hypothetical protein